MEELLLKLKAHKGSIKLVDDNLKISVPKGFNDSNFIDELKENKESLIKYIKEKKAQKKVSESIPKAPVQETYRLTPPQMRLFLLDQLNADSLAYNLPGFFWMEGELDYGQLENAFRTLIQRHESLRTSFCLDENNDPVQKILETFSFEVEHYQGTEAEVQSIINQFVRPFNLSQGPLVRVGVIKIEAQKHILLFDVHHIVSDGTSTAILIQELGQLYAGADLPALTIQYKDFSEWYLSDDYQNAVAKQKEFWNEAFIDGYTPLTLPTDFQRPKAKEYGGSAIQFSLTEAQTTALRNISLKNNTTLYSVLFSVYSIMLAKLSNSEDVVVGTPVAGRKHADLQGLIGMFVNTLALPVSITAESGFTSFLQALHEKVLLFFDNADYPYERLINDLQIERDPSRNPLFDTIFAFQNMSQASMTSDEMSIRQYEMDTTSTKFDLILDATEDATVLNFNFEYSTELFEAATIKKFINYFNRIIDQIIQNEEIALAEINLLSPKEESELVNFKQSNYPEQDTLVSLFEAQVAKNPNNEAVTFEDTSLSYAQLNNIANAIAEKLTAKGVTRDSLVGVLMDKNLYTVACFLGILKAGGAYLPIDPDYPQKRIDYMIEDSDLDILITNNIFKDVVAATSFEKIILEEQVEDLSGNTAIANPEGINQPEDLCYVIYTSGTTGNPKGVMVEHKNVVRLLINDDFQYQFSENDVWTMFHSHCFDVSVWEMYGALLYGAKLIIVPQTKARDPFEYLKILSDNNVTILNQTPTAFYSLKNACKKENILLPAVRYVVFAGEALTPLKLKEWHADHPNAKLINMYGITEVTVHTTYKEIGQVEIENNISNIGIPIPTSSMYLMDQHKNIVPKGVVGEIYVVGDGVTRGYLNKEVLTAERYTENPFIKGQRMYKSGDLGRLLENGEMEYLGRIDKQVQLKGFRIELKEIEHHLLLHEQIEEAVVIMRKSDQGQPYLCAYYLGKEEVDVDQLRAYLGKELPHYMIPSYFMKLDEIPFTSNNKVATARLPEPEAGALGKNYVAPTTSEEKIMCEVWAQELAIEKVGTKDNFFSLGGDSLKAIGLIAILNEKLNTAFTIADLYSNQTISELLATQSSKQAAEEKQAMEAAKEELRVFQENYKAATNYSEEEYDAVYPMNGVEKGMVFYTLQTKSDNIEEILYHEQNIYDMPGNDFDFETFKKVIALLCEKHGELRKVFDLDNLTHLIKREITPEINFIDITNLNKKEQEEFMAKKMHEERLRGTDLSFSVIWRMNVIKVRADYQYLLFDFNHALFDGWSLSSFMTEVQKTYLNLEADATYKPEKLQCSYKDQILGELAATKKASTVDYWKNELAEYTRFELPDTGMEHQFISDEFHLGKAYRKQLEEVAKKHNTTFKHLCFSAYIYMLRTITYGNDITTGIATNIRPLAPDAEKLLGCFLNTIPFRAQISDDITWAEYANYIEQKLRTLKYHERAPFHKILEIVEEERNEKNPIFDVFFNYVDFRILEEMQPSDENIEEEELSLRKDYLNDHALLTAHVFAHAGDFKFALTYSTTFISPALAQLMSTYFKNVLDQFLYNADAKIDKQVILKENKALSIVTQKAEDTPVQYPETETIVSLFEAQVAKHPEKEAVTFDGQSLTYAELNSIANHLANNLRAKGVGSDSIVGVLMDKNLYTVAAFLGILKAGGAYLPVDPSYPQDRIEYIIDDSNVNLLVTAQEYEDLLEKSIYKVILDEVVTEALYIKDIPNPEPVNQPEDMCYIIYTSGTTGKPKGVMVEHRNVVRLFFNDEFQFNFSENDVWTMFHSHCFDFSVWEMYGALLYGGKVVIVSASDARDPNKYVQLVQEQGVTVLNQTPTAFDSLRLASAKENITLPKIRYVIFGGEALTPIKLKDWYAAHPNVTLVNMYGITETTVHVTYKEIGQEEIENNISNIGRPIPTNAIYVLDSDGNLQPQGTVGEMYVSGAGVTRGYLNKKELTATRFTENPFKAGERLYRSGDLGRVLENGELEYLGRVDKQVQLKGFRIELKEIEHQLLVHDKVDEAIVVMKTTAEDQPYLCAYYVGTETISAKDFRTYLATYLPMYMIPSYFVQLDEMPFTANNKIAVAKLPEPEAGAATNAYVAPTNTTQKTLCEIWEEVLGYEKVGIYDNYFSLGGDSLKAIGLISAINKALNTSYSIADLYSYQTVEELAAMQQDGKSEQEIAFDLAQEELQTFQEQYIANNEFSTDVYEAVYPMNGVEMGMVFHSLQTKSDDIHEILYHEQNLYDMPGEGFDFEVFKQCVALLYNKHEELRKVFDLDNLAHLIRKEINPEINFVDITSLDKEAQEAYIQNKMNEERLRGTELSFSVIWRMNVIKIREDYQYLLFDFNHALFDGWSLSSFMTELQKTYMNLAADANFVPQKLQSSYKDQILGELAATKQESTLDYWKKELDGYVRFELPPTNLAHKYLREEYNFGKDYRSKLEKIANQHNTSFKHICFSAYIYMLRMLSYSNDMTVGITTNIRPLVADAEQLLGCFLNTIPFRAKISDDFTWEQYINYIEQKLRTFKYHERAPFHRILDIVGEESSDRNPIFDVSFNYVDFRIYNELQTDDSVEEEKTTIDKAYMNDYALLGVHIRAFDNDFTLEFTYATSFVTPEQAKMLSTYFKIVLDQLINNIDAKINKQTILKEGSDTIEKLKDYNTTAVHYDVNTTVLDEFESQVQETPEAVAVVFDGNSVTYKELNERANLWAQNLIGAYNIQQGDIVGIRMSRSIEMIVAILAIMKAGGTYMVLDASLPTTRVKHMLTESNCSHIINNQKIPMGLHNYKWITNKALDVTIEKEIALPKVTTNDIAYILYTSGSTGKPKGCMVSHANVYNYISWSNSYYFDSVAEGNWGLMTPMSFDLTVTAVFTSLTRGKALYLCAEDKSIDQLLRDCFTNPNIDTLKLTPTHITVLKDLNIQNSNITNVICGGEQLKRTHVETLQSINPEINIYNEYGPTETTVGCTVAKINADDDISIGTPIANTKIFILDEDRNEVPLGIAGEIYVSGNGVSNGYIANETLTNERFVTINNTVCYKTGDVGLWNADGNIEYVGRVDDQVKIRGFRIELGEIETALENIPSVTQAFVTDFGEGENKQLCAYLIGEEEVNTSALDKALANVLPEYMIPSGYVWMESFPLTANGKISKKALPVPDLASGEAYVAPETPKAIQMVNIWADILQADPTKIGMNDNFFKIGGHSLSTIKLKNKINKELSVNIDLKDVFTHSTVTALLEHVSKLEKTNHITIPKAEEQVYYPLSSAQKRMYFLYEFDKEGISYNMPNFYRIEGDLNIEKFDFAFNELVRRHESFRTLFELVDGVPMQRIVSADRFQVDYLGGNAEAMKKFVAEFAQPFNLAEELPTRVALMEVENEAYLMAIDSHHIMNDGFSKEILMREFWALYKGTSLEPLNIQYKDYATWQHDEAYKKLVAADESYWLAIYDEEPTTLELPSDYSRPLSKTDQGKVFNTKLNASLTSKLKAYANAEGVTMYALFLAIYNVLLNKLSNQKDIIVGTPIAGRHHADIEGIVGMFVNTLSLRNKLDTNLKFKDFLNQIKENTIQAFDHQLYPYEELVEALDLPRNMSRNPLFDVFFSYGKEAKAASITDADIQITSHNEAYDIAKFDFSLAVQDSDEISLAFTYRTDLYKDKTIARFSDYFIKIVEGILADENVQVKDIEILSQTEKNKLIHVLNETATSYNLKRTVLDEFKTQVTTNPDAIALQLKETVLSYQELDILSDKWAKNLVQLGVHSEEIVGMIMDRSVEMVVGILAVLKTGAAYLPLNPAQPTSRTAYMLTECNSSFLISNFGASKMTALADALTLVTPEMLNVELSEDIALSPIVPENVAYIIYTSGSTGKPKGVKTHHEAVMNLTMHQKAYFGLSENERILQFSPYYFDASVEQIWLALTSGAALIMIDDELLRETRLLRDYIAAQNITHVHATPSFLEKLDVSDLENLRRVVAGGEVCKPALAEKISAQYDFYNEYGPTETTVTSTILTVKKDETLGNKISIGRPIANTQAYILDDQMNLLPQGAIGELYLGGKGLSTGYLNRDELTAERFVESPFGSGKLYKTGDLVRWLENGNLDYFGRNDDQVKLRGYRIELEEIANVLEDNETIAEAIVTIHGTGDTKRLIAYLKGSNALADQEVKAYLLAQLPEYMIPVQYVWLDEFPLNANGKIDKKQLPVPQKAVVAYKAPGNETEEQLVTIFEDILNLEYDQISVDRSFFELGGNSLNAINLVNKIAKEFDIEMTLKEIFVKQTIQNISEYLITIQQIEDLEDTNTENADLLL